MTPENPRPKTEASSINPEEFPQEIRKYVDAVNETVPGLNLDEKMKLLVTSLMLRHEVGKTGKLLGMETSDVKTSFLNALDQEDTEKNLSRINSYLYEQKRKKSAEAARKNLRAKWRTPEFREKMALSNARRKGKKRKSS